VAELQALIATYEELWTIVNDLTAVNLALLHSAPPGAAVRDEQGCCRTRSRRSRTSRADQPGGAAPGAGDHTRPGLDQAIMQHVHVRERQSGYTEAEKDRGPGPAPRGRWGLPDDIGVLQADGGLGRLLARQFPSADTLRHFLYACTTSS